MNALVVIALFVVLCVVVSAFEMWLEVRHPSETAPEPFDWWYMPM